MKLHFPAAVQPKELEIFSDLRSHKSDTHFIAEGEKAVKRLLASGLDIIALYLTEDRFTSIKILIEQHHQEAELNVYLAEKEAMEKIVGFSLHQGIMAAGRIPKEKTLDEVMGSTSRPYLFVILDQIGDAENMGAIFRTSQAMNVSAMILDKKSTSPWMRRSVRVSMGAVFDMPVVTVESIRETLVRLKEKGIVTFATTLNDHAVPIWNCDSTGDTAIIFGSEGHGIKEEIIEVCDKEVAVPMRDIMHSLNVSMAHGIVLYEVMRQRKLKSDLSN